jgi:hypothetical protein
MYENNLPAKSLLSPIETKLWPGRLFFTVPGEGFRRPVAGATVDNFYVKIKNIST